MGGSYIRLNEIKKVPRVDLLTLYKFMKWFVYGLYIKESQQIMNDIAEKKFLKWWKLKLTKTLFIYW